MDNTLFLRNKDLIDQTRLDQATIIGAGGIGSALIQNAAIMGFNKLTIWDGDAIEEHNLSTTVYNSDQLGKDKVDAACNQFLKYNSTIVPRSVYWEPGMPLCNKVFVCPDNMEVREAVYDAWKANPHREFLIDMRMGALSYEVITVTKDHDNYMEWWQSSDSIPDESCTAKHTIFSGSIAASYGLSQAFNVLMNRVYYSYIWGCLAPSSFKRECLIKPKIQEKLHATSAESDQ